LSYCAISVEIYLSTADVENYPESNSFASRNTLFGGFDPELQQMHDFLNRRSDRAKS